MRSGPLRTIPVETQHETSQLNQMARTKSFKSGRPPGIVRTIDRPERRLAESPKRGCDIAENHRGHCIASFTKSCRQVDQFESPFAQLFRTEAEPISTGRALSSVASKVANADQLTQPSPSTGGRLTLYTVSADAREPVLDLIKIWGRGLQQTGRLDAVDLYRGRCGGRHTRAVGYRRVGPALSAASKRYRSSHARVTRIYSLALALTAEERVERWRRQSCAVTLVPVRIQTAGSRAPLSGLRLSRDVQLYFQPMLKPVA
jgi:hypothetical protein